MLGLFARRFRTSSSDLLASQLYNEQTFYEAFLRDLHCCTSEAIIESPFIAGKRIASLLPIFSKMRSRNVRIVVNTRHPAEHDAPYDAQAWVKRISEIAQKTSPGGILQFQITKAAPCSTPNQRLLLISTAASVMSSGRLPPPAIRRCLIFHNSKVPIDAMYCDVAHIPIPLSDNYQRHSELEWMPTC